MRTAADVRVPVNVWYKWIHEVGCKLLVRLGSLNAITRHECAVLKKGITLSLLILILRASYTRSSGGGGVVLNQVAVAQFMLVTEKKQYSAIR
jgi:hypothetical protein